VEKSLCVFKRIKCWLGSPLLVFPAPLFSGCSVARWASRPPSLSACAWRGACRLSFLRSLGFVMSFSFSASSLPVLGAVSPASASAAAAAGVAFLSGLAAPVAPPVAVCPLVSGGGVPSSVVVAGRLVPSSSFVPVVSGVVSAVSASDPRGVVCVVGGRSFRCLWSALGGRSSPAAVALVAALRVARGREFVVDLWCAPGRGGVPCPGYFCAVSL